MWEIIHTIQRKFVSSFSITKQPEIAIFTRIILIYLFRRFQHGYLNLRACMFHIIYNWRIFGIGWLYNLSYCRNQRISSISLSCDRVKISFINQLHCTIFLSIIDNKEEVDSKSELWVVKNWLDFCVGKALVLNNSSWKYTKF